jgi:hypothetical protein
MSRSQQKRMPTRPAVASESLAKLYRLYGANTITTDVFGRRAALPSEIAQQLKRRSNAAGPTGGQTSRSR